MKTKNILLIFCLFAGMAWNPLSAQSESHGSDAFWDRDKPVTIGVWCDN